MLRPLKLISPPAYIPGGCGINFISALLVTDFPEPDSPTIANVSPSYNSKLTPRTACTTPAYVLKLIRKSFTSNTFFFIAYTLLIYVISDQVRHVSRLQLR